MIEVFDIDLEKYFAIAFLPIFKSIDPGFADQADASGILPKQSLRDANRKKKPWKKYR